MAHLREDWTTTVFEDQHPTMRATITLPAGTRLRAVECQQGMAWAVEDEALLVTLTGNTHDPKYRYVFVPNALVEG